MTVIRETVGKRPFGLAIITTLTVGIMSLALSGGAYLVVQSQQWQTAELLLAITFKLVPPLVWLAGVLIVMLWLWILRRLWD